MEAKNVKILDISGDSLSLKESLEKAYKGYLGGYMALTDSVLHIIMHSHVENADGLKKVIGGGGGGLVIF